jgi:hypothetical protein
MLPLNVNPLNDVFGQIAQQASNPTNNIIDIYKQLSGQFDMEKMPQLDYEKEMQNIFSQAAGEEMGPPEDLFSSWKSFGNALRDPNNGLSDALIQIGSALLRPGSVSENLAIGLSGAMEAMNKRRQESEARKQARRAELLQEGFQKLTAKEKQVEQAKELRKEKLDLMGTAAQLFQMDSNIKQNAAQLFLRRDELEVTKQNTRRQDALVGAQIAEIQERMKANKEIPISGADSLATRLIISDMNNNTREGMASNMAFEEAVKKYAPYGPQLGQLEALAGTRPAADGTVQVGTVLDKTIRERITTLEESFKDVGGRYLPQYDTEDKRAAARKTLIEETRNIMAENAKLIGGQYGNIAGGLAAQDKAIEAQRAAKEAFARVELNDPSIVVKYENGKYVYYKDGKPLGTID